tara:strand:+ start:3316 stop:3705 length:390 start_codon:yes stop_codon:yes gene_type:complete
MPERVTKEERLVSLAIEKARKVKQELNAKNVEPTQVRVVETDPEPVKIKRPKAVNVKVENQTQDKEGYGLGGETTEHKIKKSALQGMLADINGMCSRIQSVAKQYASDNNRNALKPMMEDLSDIVRMYK